jgi:ribosome-associated protein
VKKPAVKKPAAVRKPVDPTWLTAVRAAEEKKAQDIKVLDLTGVSSFTDFFVICTGTSAKQNQAISDEVAMSLKKRGERPLSVEGYGTGEWILTDYGDIVIHALTPKARAYYDLERLWREGKAVEIPAEAPAVVKSAAVKKAAAPRKRATAPAE